MPLLSASLDDLVFEGRNQAYGAYQLRRQYSGTLASAGSITLATCALLLGAWLAWPAAPPVAKSHSQPLDLLDVQLPPPAVIEKPKPAVLVPLRAAAPRTHLAPPTPTAVAPDDLVPLAKPNALPPLAEVDGPVGPPTVGPAAELATTGPGSPGGTATEASPASAAPAGEFVAVEKMPEFAGGQAALLRYLRDHLRYPAQALREGAEGRVYMSFVVKADGTIADVSVLKGLGYGLDEEALRVVRQMPAWTPGYQAQHAVAVRFTLPITFKLQ